MKKQQHILTLIIILAVIALVAVIGSIIYDEKAKENKKAVETISAPKVEEKKEETPEIIEPEETQQEEEEKKEENEYVGEEEKVSEEQVKQTDDEKAIELAKKEWGEDDSVIFSIENKKGNKIYVAVKQDATVIQWYEVNTTNWTISEY